MKKYISISLLLTIVLFACNDNEIVEVDESTIIGEWKLTETSFSIGGPEQITNDIENGVVFVFSEDNNFTSTRFEECSTGEYAFNIEENELILNYNCSDFSSSFENENGEIIYGVRFNNSNEFSLSPRTGAICTEGCSSIYTRQ